MGRERRIWSAFLTCLSCMAGCTEAVPTYGPATITISLTGTGPATRALEPAEDEINEVDIMIFNSDGFLEERLRVNGNTAEADGKVSTSVTLLKNKRYSFYACANLGISPKVRTFEDIADLRCHLAYPDEYSEGIPMAGKTENVIIEDEGSEVVIKLERLMSKISIRMDRGGLSEDVSMQVVGLRIGNCPKTATLFRASRVTSHDECFTVGFSRNELECSILNGNLADGVSGELSLYMLENMQGPMDGISHDSGKVFPANDIRSGICSYVEIWMDYNSPSFSSMDTPLKYRFYLGGSMNDLDVERNCHYHITVIPEDDGLSGDGWRVDKSGLHKNDGGTHFSMNPSGYIQGDVGDKIHIRCTFSPSSAPFDIGLEELEYDRERGIYDYQTDADGRGVTLTLKAPGRGIVYMSAGAPVNESGMLVVEVNNIKNTIS